MLFALHTDLCALERMFMEAPIYLSLVLITRVHSLQELHCSIETRTYWRERKVVRKGGMGLTSIIYIHTFFVLHTDLCALEGMFVEAPIYVSLVLITRVHSLQELHCSIETRTNCLCSQLLATQNNIMKKVKDCSLSSNSSFVCNNISISILASTDPPHNKV